MDRLCERFLLSSALTAALLCACSQVTRTTPSQSASSSAVESTNVDFHDSGEYVLRLIEETLTFTPSAKPKDESLAAREKRAKAEEARRSSQWYYDPPADPPPSPYRTRGLQGQVFELEYLLRVQSEATGEFHRRYVESELVSKHRPIDGVEEYLTGQARIIVRSLPEGLRGKVKHDSVQIVEPGQGAGFLDAYMPNGPIRVTTGLARAMVAQCFPSALGILVMNRLHEICPAIEEERKSGFLPSSYANYEHCQLLSRDTPKWRANQLPALRACMQRAATFMLAHEIAHQYKCHRRSSLENELAVDRDAYIIARKRTGILGTKSLYFEAMEKESFDAFRINNMHAREIATKRVAALNNLREGKVAASSPTGTTSSDSLELIPTAEDLKPCPPR